MPARSNANRLAPATRGAIWAVDSPGAPPNNWSTSGRATAMRRHPGTFVAFARARRTTATRTRVGRADQLEARRHRHPFVVDAADHDPALLERFPQPVEHLDLELAHLVEEEHATVGERDLAGAEGVRAASHQ
jgi:hypothetical protein